MYWSDDFNIARFYPSAVVIVNAHIVPFEARCVAGCGHGVEDGDTGSFMEHHSFLAAVFWLAG